MCDLSTDAAIAAPRRKTIYTEMSRIIRALRREDGYKLIFLCQCLLADRSVAKEIWAANDVSRLLSELYANYSEDETLAFVREALLLIHRVDIGKNINTHSSGERTPGLPPLIKVLYKIYDETRRRDRGTILQALAMSSAGNGEYQVLEAFLSLIHQGKLTFHNGSNNIQSNYKLLRSIVPYKTLHRTVNNYLEETKLPEMYYINVPNQVPKPIQVGKDDICLKKQRPYELNPANEVQGLCVIINNEKFEKFPDNVVKQCKDRPGSSFDRDTLQDVFSLYGFKVEVHENLSSAKLVKVFKHYGSVDHSKYKIFVMAILSHGDRNQIYGVDSIRVHQSEMINCFTSANCKTLKDNPKLFILQCCQGNNFGYADGGCDCVEESVMVKPVDIEQHMCIGYATLPGKISWRNWWTGTPFIQQFCKILKESDSGVCVQNVIMNLQGYFEDMEWPVDNRIVKQYPYLYACAKPIKLQRAAYDLEF